MRKTTSIYFADGQLERLKALAKRRGSKRYAELVRIAVEEYLEKEASK